MLVKSLQTYPAIGTHECLVSRQLLAGNRLNFSAWHGYQQVLLPQGSRLQLQFRLQPLAYLLVARGNQGVRLSLHPELPSIRYRISPQGQFLAREPLLHSPLQAGRWTSLSLEGRELRLGDGPPLSLWPSPSGGRPLLGGGQRRSEVRNLKLDGHPVPLHNRLDWWPCWLLVLLLRPLRLQLMLASLLLSFSAFDRFYWSHRYAPYGLGRAFERTRAGLARALSPLDPTPPNLEPLPPEKMRPFAPALYNPQGRCSLLLLGSSQLWGSGARLPQERLAAQLAGLLPDHRIINASLWGVHARHLQERVEKLQLRADRVLIVLGNNDVDNPRFEADLEALVRACGPRPTLLVCEANSGELPLSAALKQNHESMGRVAEKLGCQRLDLDDSLRGQLDSGLLWVDRVHLSSYGQQLAAQVLATSLRTPGNSSPVP